MTRLLHISDVHLDRPFAGIGPAEARSRRREVLRTFERCVCAAEERGCDAITIGGDLWEDEHVTADTRQSVARAFERFVRPVLVIAGNHDPLLPGGHWERTEWPDNVHLFRDAAPSAYEVSGELNVWGLSWSGTPLNADFLDTFAAPTGPANVLLLHGSEYQATHFRGGHCPFTADAIEKAGFDYCLAGHYHRSSDTGRVVYPGSPEPLGWGEMGDHGIAVVEVADGDVSIELVPTNTMRYLAREVDCGGCTSGGEVIERLRAALNDENPARIGIAIELVGELAPECELRRNDLLEAAGSDYGAVRLSIATTVGYDFETLATESTVRGHFVRRLNKRIETADDEDERRLHADARLAGLRALSGRKDLLDVV